MEGISGNILLFQCCFFLSIFVAECSFKVIYLVIPTHLKTLNNKYIFRAKYTLVLLYHSLPSNSNINKKRRFISINCYVLLYVIMKSIAALHSVDYKYRLAAGQA